MQNNITIVRVDGHHQLSALSLIRYHRDSCNSRPKIFLLLIMLSLLLYGSDQLLLVCVLLIFTAAVMT